MERIFAELQQGQNVRGNLSSLRAAYRTGSEEERQVIAAFVYEHGQTVLGFLRHEDAKTRKNAALLLEQVVYEPALSALWEAYQAEETQFVKSAYLTALAAYDVTPLLPQLHALLERLAGQEVSADTQKHRDEQLRALRELLIREEGIAGHTFLPGQKKHHVLLVTNRSTSGVTERLTHGKRHPLGVVAETDDLYALLQIRTYRELLFLLPLHAPADPDPQTAAGQLAAPILTVCRNYHKEDTPFYFRIECKAPMDLKERSRFTKRLGAALTDVSGGMLVNSPGDYELELRLFADKTGRFFPALKFSGLPDRRFAYRRNAVSASMHPALAALIMELAAPYLKEHAQVLDPFCGVGTLLIERDIRVPAGDMYGTDIFGDAIAGARENASAAGEKINFIHRDFFDFKHAYPFDEIVTDMPVRGKLTREELDMLYARFFRKAQEVLAEDGIVVMYTGELGFVKKQLRLHRNFTLLEEYCMQSKTGFYLLIMKVRG